MENLKLAPHLVPSPLWGISASRQLKKSEWHKIRQDYLNAANNTCSVCNSSDPGLFCHEVWEYQERSATATLIGFMIICRACSGVIHFGRTVKAGYRDEAFQRMCQVNGITEASAEEIIQTAFRVWGQLSKISPWKVCISSALLQDYPALAALKA